MLIVLYCLIAYFFIGTGLARHNYAKQLNTSGTVIAEHAELREKMNAISHSSDCWLGTRYHKSWNTHYCDCSAKSAANPLIRRARDIGLKEPNNPYLMLGLWPVLGYHAFLTGGKIRAVPVPNQVKIDELERELRIGHS